MNEALIAVLEGPIEDPLGFWLNDLHVHGREALARLALEVVQVDQRAEPLGGGHAEARRLATDTLKAVEAWIADAGGGAAAVQAALDWLQAAAGEQYDTEDETGWSLAHLCELCLAADDEAAGGYAELVGNVCKDEAAALAAIRERVLPWARGAS